MDRRAKRERESINIPILQVENWLAYSLWQSSLELGQCFTPIYPSLRCKDVHGRGEGNQNRAVSKAFVMQLVNGSPWQAQHWGRGPNGLWELNALLLLKMIPWARTEVGCWSRWGGTYTATASSVFVLWVPRHLSLPGPHSICGQIYRISASRDADRYPVEWQKYLSM